MTRKVHLKLTGHSDAFQDPHKTVVWTCMVQMMSTNQILWVPAGLQAGSPEKSWLFTGQTLILIETPVFSPFFTSPPL